MTDLEALTLSAITRLADTSFRMQEVIKLITAGPARGTEETRHWLMLDEALVRLLDCMEKIAEVETDRMFADEVVSAVQFRWRKTDEELAEARETAEFIRQNFWRDE